MNEARSFKSKGCLPTDHPNSFTVLRAVENGSWQPLLTKIFQKNRTWKSYDHAKFYSASTVDIISLDALEAELRLLDKEPRCCFVAGAVIDGTDRNNMRRIKEAHKVIDKETKQVIRVDKPTLLDVPRYLLPVDVDSLACPTGIDPKDLIAAAAHIRSRLPSVFHNVSCVAQATSGHCIKDGLRFRMFFMMDRPLTGQEIKTWLAHEKAPADLSIYGPQAVVYTASPVFENPEHDPLPGARIVRLDGSEYVVSPSADELAKMGKPFPRPSKDGEKVVRPSDWKEIEEALNAIPVDGLSYENWLLIGMALHWAQHHRNKASDEKTNAGFELWDQFSQSSDHYDAAGLEIKWDTFDAERGGAHGPTTIGHIFTLARENGWRPLYELADDITGDVMLAREFAEKYSGEFRYVSQDKDWLHWNGVRWNPDRAEDAAFMAVQDFIAQKLNDASAAIRAANASGNEDAIKAAKFAFKGICEYLKDSRKLKALFSIIPRQRGISTSALDYDRDPWLLGVQNGVVDLRTGKLLEPDQKYNITKLVGCAYNPHARCPKFMKFLERAQPKEEVREFIQRRSGYTLTGSADEEKLFFDQGDGANGKSVYVNTMKTVMGDYAVAISAETLMNQKNDSEAKRDITKLVGVRMALANETPVGGIWSDERVKMLSSREAIPARKLYKEGFDFQPTHTLWVRGNNVPGVKDTSDGFWRRMISTKWAVTIPEGEQVIDLDKQLIAEESEGILAWIVRGCIKWKKDGLKIPESVRAEGKEYRKETDLIGRWIRETLKEEKDAQIRTAILYHDFENFCRNMGVQPMSEFAFGRAMAKRGYEGCNMDHGRRGFKGIAIDSPNEPKM